MVQVNCFTVVFWYRFLSCVTVRTSPVKPFTGEVVKVCSRPERTILLLICYRRSARGPRPTFYKYSSLTVTISKWVTNCVSVLELDNELVSSLSQHAQWVNKHATCTLTVYSVHGTRGPARDATMHNYLLCLVELLNLRVTQLRSSASVPLAWITSLICS